MSSYNNTTGTNSLFEPTGGLSKAAILDLFRTHPDLQSEFNVLVNEVIKDEFIKIHDTLKSGVTPETLELYLKARQAYPDAELSKWSFQDENGILYGYSEKIEVDVLKNAKDTYLCDIRVDVDVSNVSNLIKIGRIYKSLNQQSKLSCLIVAKYVLVKLFEIRPINSRIQECNTTSHGYN